MKLIEHQRWSFADRYWADGIGDLLDNKAELLEAVLPKPTIFDDGKYYRARILVTGVNYDVQPLDRTWGIELYDGRDTSLSVSIPNKVLQFITRIRNPEVDYNYWLNNSWRQKPVVLLATYDYYHGSYHNIEFREKYSLVYVQNVRRPGREPKAKESRSGLQIQTGLVGI